MGGEGGVRHAMQGTGGAVGDGREGLQRTSGMCRAALDRTDSLFVCLLGL